MAERLLANVAPAQIAVANEIAPSKGGVVPDIGTLRAGNFYAALEGSAFHKIRAPWCLSHHPQSPPATEEALRLARQDRDDDWTDINGESRCHLSD